MKETLKITARITAVGGYVPPTIIDNKALGQLIDPSDEWIMARTRTEGFLLAHNENGI